MIINIEDYLCSSSPIQRPVEYTLYKPRERNKKGLDAVQSSTQAFILQITINKRHPGLKIDDAFWDFPSVTEWFVCCIHLSDVDDFHFPAVLPDSSIFPLLKYIHQHSNVHIQV